MIKKIIHVLVLALIIQTFPITTSASAPDLTFEYPDYLMIADWLIHEDTIYVAAAGRKDNYNGSNLLFLIDKNTLTISKIVDIGENIEESIFTDIEYDNGVIYLSNYNHIVTFDIKEETMETIIDLNDALINDIEVKNGKLYFADSRSTNPWGKHIERIYILDLITKELTTIPDELWIYKPNIELHPIKDILYIGETYFSHSSKESATFRMFSFNSNTLEQMNKFEVAYKDQTTTSYIHVDQESLYYGKYKFDANNITAPVGEFDINGMGIQLVKQGIAFTNQYGYDANTLQAVEELNLGTSFSLFTFDENGHIFTYSSYSEPDKQVFTKEPFHRFEKPKFTDLTSFSEEIYYLRDLGIIKGFTETEFKPYQPIKRVDAVRMIMRELNLDLTDIVDPGFEDITVYSPGYSEIAKAYELGIINGKTDRKFAPSDYLTRAEMSKILAKAYNLEGTFEKGFKDVTNSSYWGYPFIHALAANSITVGYPDGTFKPTKQITRQEFAAFMARYLNPKFIAQ